MLEIGDCRKGALSDGGTVALSVESVHCLTQIAGWSGFDASAAGLLGGLGLAFPVAYDRAAKAGRLRAWRIAPDRLLLQSREEPSFEAVFGRVTLDLSHAKTAVRIAGPGAARLLARVAAIDFSEKGFPAGSFVQTAIHGIGVLIDRPEPDAFEVFMPGS